MKAIKVAAESQLLSGRRALSLVETLARVPGGLTFSRLETAIGVSAASLSRLLKMLLNEGWVENEPSGKYAIAARMMTLARHLNGHWSEHEILEPVVQELARLTGHSACFARFANDAFTLTAKTEMPSSYHFIELFTKNYDNVSNGMGLTLLAYQDPDTARYIIEEAVGGKPCVDTLNGIRNIREAGFFVNEESTVTRISVPVHAGIGNTINGVIAIAGLKLTASEIGKCLNNVQRAAEEAEHRLSHSERNARSA